jgi:hypothetical protein
MEDLLALAIESHGGQARWDAIRGVTAELSIGGALWEIKGKAGILHSARHAQPLHRARPSRTIYPGPFGARDRCRHGDRDTQQP